MGHHTKDCPDKFDPRGGGKSTQQNYLVLYMTKEMEEVREELGLQKEGQFYNKESISYEEDDYGKHRESAMSGCECEGVVAGLEQKDYSKGEEPPERIECNSCHFGAVECNKTNHCKRDEVPDYVRQKMIETTGFEYPEKFKNDLFEHDGALAYAQGLADHAVYLSKKCILEGKAVVDCGATESIGGYEAIQALVEARRQQGDDRVRVDLQNRPVYSFGNGQKERVLSQVAVGIQVDGDKSEFRVHALSAEGVPLLASIAALRSLGAVIDFDTGVALFRKARNPRPVQLERAPSGHLLLDLARDLRGSADAPVPRADGISELLAATATTRTEAGAPPSAPDQ